MSNNFYNTSFKYDKQTILKIMWELIDFVNWKTISVRVYKTMCKDWIFYDDIMLSMYFLQCEGFGIYDHEKQTFTFN